VSLHAGDHVPLWLTANRQGLSSLSNSTYVRGAAFYRDTLGSWQMEGGLDLAVAAGFTSRFVWQQGYAGVRYRWLGLWAGSREKASPLLNPSLSSGGLTWSGNARPIPQVCLGLPDYVQLWPRLAFKAELSYGWFTDNRYQAKRVGEGYWYTRSIKYHHKSAFVRIGLPEGRWLLDVGMSLDVQFGGYKVGGADAGDLGNGWKDYLRVLIPSSGGSSSPQGEQIAYQGNSMGSEHLRLTYRHPTFSLSAYLENYYDDFSGMGKLNGWDGLWGLEYRSARPQLVRGVVIEYLQTTNQSGPLHGLDHSRVGKTGGADDYYNNDWYPGWVHWGMAIGNPLIASPIYNADGDPAFKYNRVRALHIGWDGCLGRQWDYTAKLSYNRTYGTPFRPLADILENFSTFASFSYTPRRWPGWQLHLATAFDAGGIYGNSAGWQLTLQKTF
jgi:hypothetical protein